MQEVREKRVRDVIEGHQIYFASAKEFNDPFDSRLITVNAAQTMLYQCQETVASIEMTGDWVAMTKDISSKLLTLSQTIDYAQSAVYKVGILCLCDTPHSGLMWSHYADRHEGVCFEFDTQYKPFADASKVHYQQERPRLDSGAPLLAKQLDWHYEREWRVLCPPSDGGASEVHVFPAAALVSVILGCRMKEHLRTRVEEWTKRNGISLKRAVISDDTYAVEIL